MTLAANPWQWVADAWADPADSAVDAFEVLGYEPNCLPRIAAAKEAGFETPVDAKRSGVDLPEPCGRCPQEQFHAATEDDVLFGGQAGGGKTKSLLMEGIRACVRYPGIWVGAYRRTYDELAESLLKELQKLAYAMALGASWNKTEKELTFPMRAGKVSKFRFRYAESIDDAVRRQGGDYQLLLVDERTLMPPGVVPVLQERLRSSDPDIPVLGTRCTANPGGPGHGETKAAYIDATDDGAKVVTDEHDRTRRFIRSRLSDNPYLDRDQTYHRTLDAIPDPARRKAMKEGDWSVFAGQFFAAWSRERHVVEPMPLPDEWDREEGIDYGYAAPWAVLVGAFDNDGRCWITHELYDTGVGQTDQARRILATEAGAGITPAARHADPSMWAKTGEANSNAAIYADEGCVLRKAVNDRVNGWSRVLEYLTDLPACDFHRAKGWEMCPRLHVFSSCANLIRTLPNAPRDKNKPEDIDTTCDDHALDALRYLLMGRGVPFVPAPPMEDTQENAWAAGAGLADVDGWDDGGYGYDSGWGR